MTTGVTNVLLAGVARQPVLATARLLAEAALLAGLDVSLSECPSPAAWGGPTSVHVRLGDEVHSPLVREREADVLVGFEQLEALRHAHLLAPHGFAALNERLLRTWRMRAGLEPAPDVTARLMAVTPRVVSVPAESLVQGLGGAPLIGLVLLGVVSPLLPVPEHAYQAVLAAGAADLEVRRAALRRGRELFAALPSCVTAPRAI